MQKLGTNHPSFKCPKNISSSVKLGICSYFYHISSFIIWKNATEGPNLNLAHLTLPKRIWMTLTTIFLADTLSKSSNIGQILPSLIKSSHLFS